MVQEIVPFIEIFLLKRKNCYLRLLLHIISITTQVLVLIQVYIYILLVKKPFVVDMQPQQWKDCKSIVILSYLLPNSCSGIICSIGTSLGSSRLGSYLNTTKVGKLLKTFLYVVGGNLTQVLSRFKVLITSNTAMGMTCSNFSPLLQIKVKLYNPPPSFSLLPQ